MKVSDLNEQQLRELEILLEYNSKQILKTGYHTNFRYGVRSNNPRLAVFLVFFNVMDQIHSIYCVASNYKVISLLPEKYLFEDFSFITTEEMDKLEKLPSVEKGNKDVKQGIEKMYSWYLEKK